MMLVVVLGSGLTEMRAGWIECVIIHGLIKGVPTYSARAFRLVRARIILRARMILA
jgi:hypothetical protein